MKLWLSVVLLLPTVLFFHCMMIIISKHCMFENESGLRHQVTIAEAGGPVGPQGGHIAKMGRLEEVIFQL